MGVSESNLRCVLLCTPLNPGCHGSLGTFKTDRQHLTSEITSWHYWAAANASVTFFSQQDMAFNSLWLGLSFLWCSLCWGIKKKNWCGHPGQGKGEEGTKTKVQEHPGLEQERAVPSCGRWACTWERWDLCLHPLLEHGWCRPRQRHPPGNPWAWGIGQHHPWTIPQGNLSTAPSLWRVRDFSCGAGV